MKTEVTTSWLDELAFETEVNGHKFYMENDPIVSGQDRGPRPKPLLLAALGGCTSMDVISILAKMKIVPESFKVHVSADVSEDHPKIYQDMLVVYEIKGPGFENNEEILKKVKHAVELSTTKYCAVSAMLSKATQISHDIRLLNS
ncbi:MAG: OsmC family protein [Bacteroidetes bacterium]|nr:OsmC family protein [Bacteroidota bacterium]